MSLETLAFFKKSLLLPDTIVKTMVKIIFLTLSNADMQLIKKKLI